MFLGTKQNLDSMFLAQTTSTTYEELEDKPNGDHSVVHEEFIKRPSCSADGFLFLVTISSTSSDSEMIFHSEDAASYYIPEDMT